MPFLKKAEMQQLDGKYGANKHNGIVALENISKDEMIFICDADKCMYYPWYDTRHKCTKEELNRVIEQYPDSRDYIYAYSCMVDDDIYHLPKHFRSKVVTEECALFNHSCSPNVGYADDVLAEHVALRDIKSGEELTIHYGFYETENSLHDGLKCKCGSSECSGILHFDFYRSPEFQDRYYKYCSGYVKSKMRSLRHDIER
jgi:SET domain-containing protein